MEVATEWPKLDRELVYRFTGQTDILDVGTAHANGMRSAAALDENAAEIRARGCLSILQALSGGTLAWRCGIDHAKALHGKTSFAQYSCTFVEP